MRSSRGRPHNLWLARRLFAQNGSCFYCGHALCIREGSPRSNIKPREEAFSKERPHTLDHVTPVSKGGSRGRLNTVLACAPCNLTKGPRNPKPNELNRLKTLNDRCAELALKAVQKNNRRNRRV